MSIKNTSYNLLMKEGGEWLGVARNWIQRKFKNGERVMWGSTDRLDGVGLCVRDIEQLASYISESAINEFLGNE